jgi:putative phosphonate metabolism protein
MKPRYAIYFAPDQGSPWWEFGAGWLGRDECRDVNKVQPALDPIGPAELREITAQPRRYGFHATLKAPFSLSGSHSADDLIARLQALAATLKPVPLGPMQATLLGDFVALVPAIASHDLMALAAVCVASLDDLRTPLSEADLARRRIEELDAREQELLHLYGYPYVLERFRFHLTLSGPVAPATAQRVLQAVAAPVAQLNATTPLVLDRLCLFVEPAPGQPLQRIADAGLLA